ncbi:MAG: shikimate kinase [Acidimicrobiia bacterium]
MTGPTDHIVIIGPMAAGKTTVGRGIAQRLALAFVDSDDQIREHRGANAASIAGSQGVETLHRLELQMFWDALHSPDTSVIAAAASVIEQEEVRRVLQEVRCVWVDAEEEMLRPRRLSAAHRREITDDEAKRLATRRPWFSSCADVRVDTGLLSEHDAVSIAVEAITRRDSR